MYLDNPLNGQGPWFIVHIVPFAFYVCHLAKMAHSKLSPLFFHKVSELHIHEM